MVLKGATLAGKIGGGELQLSPAAESPETSESPEGESQASATDASIQGSSTSGDETLKTAGGGKRPFIEPVLQSAEEYYRARGVITEGQLGTEDKPDSEEMPSEEKGSKAAAFVEPQLQSAEEHYRQLGLTSEEAPSQQGEANAEAEAAAEDKEKVLGSDGELDTEEEPSWNLAASGKLPAQLSDDAAGASGNAVMPEPLQEGQAAERDPAEPLEIVLDDAAGELPAGWYKDRPRSAGGPEEPFWNAAGKARVVVKRQTGKKASNGVTEARHRLRIRQR